MAVGRLCKAVKNSCAAAIFYCLNFLSVNAFSLKVRKSRNTIKNLPLENASPKTGFRCRYGNPRFCRRKPPDGYSFRHREKRVIIQQSEKFIIYNKLNWSGWCPFTGVKQGKQATNFSMRLKMSPVSGPDRTCSSLRL